MLKEKLNPSSFLWRCRWSLVPWTCRSHSVKPGASGAHPISEPGTVGLFLVSWFEYLEAAHQRFIYAHHRAGIVELAAVVGRRKESDELALAEELVSVLNYLMSAADQVDVVSVIELLHDVFAEGKAHTTVVLTPFRHLFVGVRPQKVAKEACVGHIRRPNNIVNSKNFV